MRTTDIDVFDFFSGCGGTSCGFQKSGMNIKFGLDFDNDASATFARNFPGALVLNRDIREVRPEDLSEAVGRRQKPLLFSGCAPCQPFSKQNRQIRKVDSRRSLLAEFSRFVEYWVPEFVFIENVPGMQWFNEKAGPLATFKRKLKSLGYSIEARVVSASSYGVPQTRQRFVLLASRLGGVVLPSATHGPGAKPLATVRDWIEGLPPLAAGESCADDPDHQCARLSTVNLKRIRFTPEGGGRESWPASLWLECHKRHSGHSDVYGRLAWDKPAAGLTTRCISYSNGRFGHPSQDRALSVREAACLQTFPADFKFCGSLISKAQQVGNAVPPLMAERFGQVFKSMLHAIAN